MNQEIKLTIIILISTAALIVGILCVYTYNEVQRLNDEITKTKINELLTLHSRFTLRLQHIMGIMELVSQTPQMAAPPMHANLISDHLKGIPADVDSDKRELARMLLDKKFDLDYVYYVVPNGDVYFLEPYSSQLNVQQLNLAFRDWYKGAISTGNTYVSEVYISTNKQHNVISVAVPMYGSNQTLTGIFGSTLNLGAVQRSLSELNLSQNEYLLITDHSDNVVIDSRKSESDVEIRRFALDLPASRGNDINIMTEVIDGKDVMILSKTLRVGTHDWSVISVQPYSDAFASSIALRNEAIVLIVVILTLIGSAGFFMIRKINANITLTHLLRKINSELDQKTEEIKQVGIKKEEFSAMITHELKTPLVPVLGYCKMLKNKMLGELTGEQLESIITIENNAKRLVSLINDILDARKLDLNKMRFDLEDVSVDEFFESLNASYMMLKEKGKEFTTNLQVHGLTMRTDKTRLRQIFDNLISNAIKFTNDKDAKIEVGMKYADDKIIFYVKDNGIGIPPDKQPNLFKKFYQIDTSERRKAGGTGLGLAISKGIVENLNGRIWVESDGKTGSTFYFEFSK